MGFTHVTDIQQYIPPSVFYKTAGTWTPTLASNVVMDVRTAAAASFNVYIPIMGLPSSVVGSQGAKLTAIEVHYRVAVAVLTNISAVTLNRVRFRIPGQIPQGDLIDVTLDADHLTDAERCAVEHHQMIVTVDTPTFIEKHQSNWLVMVCEGSANGVLTLHGAVARYTLRL